MSDPARVFRLRFVGLVATLAIAVLVFGELAFVAARHANGTLNQLASVELDAALLARQFRTAVDDLHGALLRIGTGAHADAASIIKARRQLLKNWIAARNGTARSDSEKKVLKQLSAEIRSYFAKLDAVAAREGGYTTQLDRDSIVKFDDAANRLQSLADEYAAVHESELQVFLENSLASIQLLRDLVLVCLAILVVATIFVVIVLYRDVVRPLRQRLFRSENLRMRGEKLAALGTLAAGVAHEIRNPLTAIKARLYTLQRGLESPEAVQDAAAISGEINRLEHIVRDVLGYARPSDPKLVDFEVSAWLHELAAFLKPGLEADRIVLAVEADAEVSIRADADQLRQAMLNLVRNAQEAFGSKPGRIVLGLTRETIVLRGKVTDAAVVSVTDNGPGITRETQARLFDPFFTTKASGTGLGLSIVARLVEMHGGEIAFQTAPGAGTRFSLRLPLSEKRVEVFAS